MLWRITDHVEVRSIFSRLKRQVIKSVEVRNRYDMWTNSQDRSYGKLKIENSIKAQSRYLYLSQVRYFFKVFMNSQRYFLKVWQEKLCVHIKSALHVSVSTPNLSAWKRKLRGNKSLTSLTGHYKFVPWSGRKRRKGQRYLREKYLAHLLYQKMAVNVSSDYRGG